MVRRRLAREGLRPVRESLVVLLRRMARSAIVLFLGSVLFLSSTARASDPCMSDRLLPAIQAIEVKFRGWRLITLSALSDEDQRTWRQERNGDCPSIALGDFDGSGRRQYAALLISKKATPVQGETYSTRQMRLLHVVSAQDGAYSFSTITQDVTTLIPVVYRSPPGQYEYFKTNSDVKTVIQISTDVIVVEVMESSSTAYFFKKGKFVALTLSF